MATAIHQYEDKLLDFAYGELPAPEASAVESHVKACTRCTQALDQIRGVRATMAALPQEPTPAAGLESLLSYAAAAAARNAAAPRPTVAWWRRMVAPLAGACALTLVAVVAIKTQDDVDFTREKAALEATPRAEEKAVAPALAEVAAAPVAAAPKSEPAEELPVPEKVAQRMKTGKVSGALAGVEADRKAKEERNWDANKQDALAKNTEGYQQELGATRGPAEERQRAQREDLGSNLKLATKESKSRREADWGNTRGGYVQGKPAPQAGKKEQSPARDESAELASGDGTKDKSGAAAPMGLSAAKPSAAPGPAPVARPAPAPSTQAAPKQVAANEPAVQQQQPASLGMSINAGPGSGSAGTRSSPSAYKKGSRDSLDDDLAGRGVNELANSRRLSNDVEAEQRSVELQARQHLEAARSAANQSNHQEEVKQALAALATNVTGAPRAEALNRLCSALEELGNEGQADKYCDALLREFPNTTAAKLVANRRNNLQRAKKSPAPARAYEADSEKKLEPAKAKATDEAKPAAAY